MVASEALDPSTRALWARSFENLLSQFNSLPRDLTFISWVTTEHYEAGLRPMIFFGHPYGTRTHQGLENRLLQPLSNIGPSHATVKRRERLGAMLSYCHYEAA